VATLRFIQKLTAHRQLAPVSAKRNKAKKGNGTRMQAVALIAAVVILFCLAYVLTFWLHAN